MDRNTDDVAVLNFCLFAFVVTMSSTVQVYASTHYCLPNNLVNIQGDRQGTIKTLLSGKSSYGNNMKCEWLLDAGLGNRIHILTTIFDLQYTPPYVSCYGNDYIDVYNGQSSSSQLLGSFCGRNNPYEMVSVGQYLFFTFSTNDKNFYDHGGIHMNFEVFSEGECPPGWYNMSSCFKLMLMPSGGAEWTDAQKYCSYSQSNLAKYKSSAEFDFVQATFMRPGTTHAWLGLNDIENTKSYVWLDNSSPSSDLKKKFDSSIYSDDTKNCVVHNFALQKLLAKDCKRESYHFLCLQDGNTTVYKVPEKSNKGAGLVGQKDTRMLILSVTTVLVCGVVFLIVGLSVIIKCVVKYQRRNDASSNPDIQMQLLHVEVNGHISPMEGPTACVQQQTFIPSAFTTSNPVHVQGDSQSSEPLSGDTI